MAEIDLYKGFAKKVDRNNSIGLVRYILALGVLIAHFNTLCGADLPWIVSSYDSVCGFFTISGFLLVYPILRGKSIKDFLINRMWRLLPSYIFVVIFFAVALFFVSTLSFKEYFLSWGFYKYLIYNITSLNFVCPTLPGVFESLTIPAVNGSLWTIKIEWQLSISIPIIIYLIAKCRLNFRWSISCILMLSLSYRVYFDYLYDITGNELYLILGRQFIGQMLFFYCGIFIYTYYDKLTKNLLLCLILSIFAFIVIKMIPENSISQQFLYPFILSFFVIMLSCIPYDLAKLVDGGHNISYEIYLIHFPIFQLLAHFKIIDTLGTIPAFILALLLIILLSIVTYCIVGHLYLTRKMKRQIN